MATYRTSVAGGGSSGTSNRTVAITPAVGDLLIVFVCVAANTNDSPTVTDNNGSGTYDRIKVDNFQSSVPTDYRISVHVRTARMVNTTSTTVTANTGSNTAGEIVVVAVSGMTLVGSSAVRQSAGQDNQSGTPAPVFGSAALTENMTLAAAGNSSASPIFTEPSGWTERQDANQTSPTTALEVATRDSGFTGTTVTWGSASGTNFGSIIIELDAGDPSITAATTGGFGLSENQIHEPSISASATTGFSIEGGLLFEDLLSCAITAGFSTDDIATLEDSLIYGATSSFTPADTTEAFDSLTIGATAEYSVSDNLDMDEALSYSTMAAFVTEGGLDMNETASLSVVAGFTAADDLTAEESLSFGITSGFTLLAALTMEEFVSYGTTLDYITEGEISSATFEEAITTAALAGINLTTDLTAENTLQFGLLTGAAMQGHAEMEEALAYLAACGFILGDSIAAPMIRGLGTASESLASGGSASDTNGNGAHESETLTGTVRDS